jgi:hypothetical protein
LYHSTPGLREIKKKGGRRSSRAAGQHPEERCPEQPHFVYLLNTLKPSVEWNKSL